MVLENPGLPAGSRITESLFAGLQIILPGEIAPAHRHVATALRFIIEGRDAFTAVAGEKTMMVPGDFVITPSMTWHDHGNEGSGPMVWLDGLDMHIVNLFAASFREGYPERVQPIHRPEGAAMVEAGSNLMPVDQEHGTLTSPIFNYPYARTREALDKLARFRKINAWHGHKMRYVNPVNGGWALPTMATWMQLLPKAFETRPYRSTDGTVFTVVEGSGRSRVGDQVFEWGAHDIFVVPSWVTVQHMGHEDAVLFSYSDRAVQDKLDLFREEQL
jgi:gentisate 1,2-dioxygenase